MASCLHCGFNEAGIFACFLIVSGSNSYLDFKKGLARICQTLYEHLTCAVGYMSEFFLRLKWQQVVIQRREYECCLDGNFQQLE